MKQDKREWSKSYTAEADIRAKAATGKVLLTSIQKELMGMRPMIVKSTDRKLLDSAIAAKSYDDVRTHVIQTLTNISDQEHPLYDIENNRPSREAMRLFYNMPATVLCYFDMTKSALKDLQCSPQAEKNLTKREFLLWQLTDRDARNSEENRVDYFNKKLKRYGYAPLDKEDPTDRLALTLLKQEREFDEGVEHPQNARKTMSKILHDENESINPNGNAQ